MEPNPIRMRFVIVETMITGMKKDSRGITMPRDGDLVQTPENKKQMTSHATGLLVRLARHLPVGSIRIIGPDGHMHKVAGPNPGPHAELHIHNERCIRRFMIGGMLGFNEAYLDEDWSSPDITALFDYALANEKAMSDVLQGKGWYRFLSGLGHMFRRNTRKGSRKNISAHYDLGNAFYKAWLDPSMTYSSALFADPDRPDPAENLTTAQARKYDHLAQQLQLTEGMHVLEVGCGWGGFAEYAASERGLTVTGLTLSKEQLDFAQERIAQKGLQDKVVFKLQDYRDEKGIYDGIASIEMFEAVGEKYWPKYFETLRKCLKPGGSATLQIITVRDDRWDIYRRGVDFIQKYIFPGGMLPSPSALLTEVDRAGLQFQKSIEFGQSYSQTLRRWYQDFNKKWDQVADLGFDSRFRRMWNLYLTSCASTFASGNCDVTQITVSNQKPN